MNLENYKERKFCQRPKQILKEIEKLKYETYEKKNMKHLQVNKEEKEKTNESLIMSRYS